MRQAHFLALAVVAAASLGCGDGAQPPTAPSAASAAFTTSALSFSQISAGAAHTCGVTTSHEAYCWGQDTKERLGNGPDAGGGPTPSPVVGGLPFRQVSAGTYHTCGVTVTDEPYCWGFNASGQLGTGDDRNSPVPVFGDFGRLFSTISAGQQHTCGSDFLMCWGNNDYAQLGLGDKLSRSAPEFIDFFVRLGLTPGQVSAGGYHTCVVTVEDTAWCWGRNYRGVLGTGDVLGHRRPVQVVGGHPFSQISAGIWHTCGVTTAGEAYCWGWNAYGQLGNGTGVNSRVPTPVAGGLRFKTVTAGSEHTCGVTTDDRAYCWGHNQYGQLGIGRRADRNRPVPVAGGLRFTDISAGASDAGPRYGFHTCGVTADHVAYCWGANHFGQLGNPVEGFSRVPVAVGEPT